MTLTQFTTSIFILDGDPVTAFSQKQFLETHEHDVEIVEPNGRVGLSHIDYQDILLMDIGVDNPKAFSALDWLLKAPIRPKLLITAFENQIFEKDDYLGSGAARILFKPFSPPDLLCAVTDLTLASHG